MTTDSPGYFDLVAYDTCDPVVRLLVSDHLLGGLANSGVLPTIRRIANLRGVVSPTVVYPDASAKPFGFPNGLALRTSEWIYPLSVPDMGCGFEVVDTGIEIDPCDPPPELPQVLNAIEREVGTESVERRKLPNYVGDALHGGLETMDPPTNFERVPVREEYNSWPATTSLLSASDLGDLQRYLGAATGHFVAVHVVRESESSAGYPRGRLVVVVHTGSAPIRETLNRTGYYLDLATWSTGQGYSTERDAADGLFAVPADSPRGRDLLGIAMACRNFGYANRESVADRVVGILLRYFGCSQRQRACEVRHVDHVSLELEENDVILARRGLQPTNAGRMTFVAGGAFSHAYLCSTADAAGAAHAALCPHGSPVLPWSARQMYVDDVTGWARRNRSFGCAERLVSNVPFDEGVMLADVYNLEEMLTYTESLAWMARGSLVAPVLNYQDRSLSASIASVT